MLNSTLKVEVLTGQFINISLTSATRMEDEMEGEDDNLLLSELEVGNFLVMQGFENGASSISATQIKRETDTLNTELQGVVTAASNSAFTILGVTFQVDGSTVYDGSGGNAGFLNLITLDQSVIKIIVDDAADAFANQVELSD